MLARLLTAHALAAKDTIYVGDTPEDEVAAAANGLHFAAVTWGYGKFTTTTNPRFATVPALQDYLRK
jgi:phosphoglycolate phosphatase-like HAD superfamily hydrolase